MTSSFVFPSIGLLNEGQKEHGAANRYSAASLIGLELDPGPSKKKH